MEILFAGHSNEYKMESFAVNTAVHFYNYCDYFYFTAVII